MSHTYTLMEKIYRQCHKHSQKGKVNTLFNHLNSVDPHIKSTMETPANDVNIPFLDIKCSLNPDSTISTLVFRKPTHSDCYLDWNSNHPISAKKAVIEALTYRAEMFAPSLKSWLKKWSTSIEYYSKTTIQIGSSKILKRNIQLLMKIQMLV